MTIARRTLVALLLLAPLAVEGQVLSRGWEIENWGWLRAPTIHGYAVDSVAGDDLGGTNPCTVTLTASLTRVTKGTPCRTIARLLAVAPPAGSVIALARGSYWREMIYIPWGGLSGGLLNGSSVVAYGSGARPMFDGADVIPAGSWTKTAGRTYVYQATVSSASIASLAAGMGNRIWQDGARLTYVADQATCDSTPGSWTGPTRPSGGSDTFYVHASDDSDPSSNGRVYEWPARPWCVQGGQYTGDTNRITTIRGVACQKYGSHDGGILTSAYLSDFSVDGVGYGPADPLHALWCNGTCEDGTASDAVSYGNNLSAVTLRRIHFTCNGNNGYNQSGFFFHSGSVGLYKHAKKTLEDISGTTCYTLIGGNSATQVSIIRPTATDNTVRTLVALGYVDRLDIVGARWVQNTATTDGNAILLNGIGLNSTVNIFDGRFVTNRAASYALISADTAAGSVNLSGNSFVFTSGPPSMGAGYRNVVSNRTTLANGGSVTLSRNLMAYVGNPLYLPSSTSITSDRNLYDTTASGWNVNGTTYATWALWQASGRDANGGQEAITMAGNPALCETQPVSGSAAWTIGAGADAWGDANAAAFIQSIP